MTASWDDKPAEFTPDWTDEAERELRPRRYRHPRSWNWLRIYAVGFWLALPIIFVLAWHPW